MCRQNCRKNRPNVSPHCAPPNCHPIVSHLFEGKRQKIKRNRKPQNTKIGGTSVVVLQLCDTLLPCNSLVLKALAPLEHSPPAYVCGCGTLVTEGCLRRRGGELQATRSLRTWRGLIASTPLGATTSVRASANLARRFPYHFALYVGVCHRRRLALWVALLSWPENIRTLLLSLPPSLPPFLPLYRYWAGCYLD